MNDSMKKNVIAACAAVLVALVAVACAGQPAHETQQSAPATESTAQAPAEQAAPAEGAPMEGAPAEGAPAAEAPAEGMPAEAPPQN
ncbi:MAG: hypothetical protein ACRD6R_06210 [Candidatus Polarisedimenticolia bacterium]